MDIFIELTATIMQNFLIIWFISGYCGYKYNGIKRYISFGIILLADCVFVSIINKFISYSFKSIKLSYLHLISDVLIYLRCHIFRCSTSFRSITYLYEVFKVHTVL